MESVEIHGPAEVYLGDNITLECVTGESFPGEKNFSISQTEICHKQGSSAPFKSSRNWGGGGIGRGWAQNFKKGPIFK